MKRVMTVVAIVITLGLGIAPVANANPPQYISCPGGYIVPVPEPCPPFTTPISIHPGQPPPTGGGGGGGLLGAVGRVLGGLTGGLL